MLYFQPKNAWFADCMPFEKDGVFYLYYLRDKRVPVPFEPFCWDLVLTKDFINFESCGEVIPKGDPAGHDQYVSSGSVFQDREGLYHAFYGAFNRDFIKTEKPSQVIMHAQSRDLFNWEKTPGVCFLPPEKGFDKDDWRDPFVLWYEETAR
jgi:beta-fructofuranosidase